MPHTTYTVFDGEGRELSVPDATDHPDARFAVQLRDFGGQRVIALWRRDLLGRGDWTEAFSCFAPAAAALADEIKALATVQAPTIPDTPPGEED